MCLRVERHDRGAVLGRDHAREGGEVAADAHQPGDFGQIWFLLIEEDDPAAVRRHDVRPRRRRRERGRVLGSNPLHRVDRRSLAVDPDGEVSGR